MHKVIDARRGDIRASSRDSSDVRTLMHTRLYWLDGIVTTKKLLKRKCALPAGQVALVEQRKNRPVPKYIGWRTKA
jgi:hypothetical protein